MRTRETDWRPFVVATAVPVWNVEKPVPRIAGDARTEHRRRTRTQFNGNKYINIKMNRASPTLVAEL